MAERDRGGQADALTGLGTQLRHVLDLMDGDVASVLSDLGVTGYRPRFSPVVRALGVLGPSSIRDLAEVTGVTHSAASQTVAQMSRDRSTGATWKWLRYWNWRRPSKPEP